MNPGQSIFFFCPMGVGKTTIGRQLARLLNYEFVDSDHEIEAKSGASIPWIFDVEGEQGFRQREQAMLDELSQRPSIVLATGGGAVVLVENRRVLQKRGIVVYLKADVDELLRRTAHDKNRPLLQTDDPAAALSALITEREPWYMEVADIVFDTQRKNSGPTANLLLKQINKLD